MISLYKTQQYNPKLFFSTFSVEHNILNFYK